MKFENIVNQYSNLAYKITIDMISSPYDAQDIVQDSYLSLYKHFKEYKGLKENDIKNILCKIVLNKCKDYLKSSKRKEVNVLDNDLDFRENTLTDEFETDNIDRVVNLINALNRPYCDLLKMYYIEEYSLDDISNKMNTTKGTIKVQITRGKQKLKEILRKERNFMKQTENIEKIENLLSDDNKLEDYILRMEKQGVCVPKDLKRNILIKVQNKKNKYYMNICKIAACLIFGLVICRTDFITNDNLQIRKQESLSSKIEIREKFSDVCSFLKTPINLERK